MNTTEQKISITENADFNINVISLLAQLAGLFHDVGKSTALFQKKLKPDFTAKSFEPYRHEWVSLRIFQSFVGNSTDFDWLKRLSNSDKNTETLILKNLECLKDGLVENPQNAFECLPPVAKLVAWLIVSHHKLPQYPKEGKNPPMFENIELWLSKLFEASWNSPQSLNIEWPKSVIKDNWSFPLGTPFNSNTWLSHIRETARNILNEKKIFTTDWFNQHFTTHLARLSIMLADHYYSSIKETTSTWQDPTYSAYANTQKNEKGEKIYNQKLDEHNIAVGLNASNIAKTFPFLRNDLPSLSLNEELLKSVPEIYEHQFGWQDKAFKLATSLKDSTKKFGFFGISMASTGKGKTRANAKIMYGLNDDNKCRFSVALGLRTLTLQTGDALKNDLKLTKNELAVLIGSQAVKDLHQQTHEEKISNEEHRGSGSAESLLTDEVVLSENLPQYNGLLAKWLRHDPKILKLIQAPVLVSTIDYLMPATEGIRGGRQIAPMLRLLTSDLVLDEPDDFGLEDLPALCRLVNWAGMLGSKVLLSTATISPALAKTLFSSYQAGRKQFAQVNGNSGALSGICCAWFDEFKEPNSDIINDVSDYEKVHNQFVEKRIHNLLSNTIPLRKSKIVSLQKKRDSSPSQLIANKIRESIISLHEKHNVIVENKKVSIGLVRMANISPLVSVAKYLLNHNAPKDHVIHYCVYHSQFPLLQRSKIENLLDKALNRNDEKEWLSQSGIPEIVDSSDVKNHIFIVLATAVAEVGRDHDYDWAIVEPSSMRSFIQLAGRVQRHRMLPPLNENIFILSKNYKGLKGIKPCFEKPGFEGKSLLYAHSDLLELNCEHELKEITAISRIKKLNKAPLLELCDTGEKPKFKVFNELEHFSQSLRLEGSKSQKNCASQWWLNEVSWCGELQRIQPFRKSKPTADYKLILTRTNKAIWQKKVSKQSHIEFLNTNDISRQPEKIHMGLGNMIWGTFSLKEEIEKLCKQLKEEKAVIMDKFTHLSLRVLDADNGQQWQYHPVLGIYQSLNKDDYE